jgi:hypothetical protein
MLDDLYRGCPDVGHTTLRTHLKTSPFFALLLDIRQSCRGCNRILSVLVFLLAGSIP